MGKRLRQQRMGRGTLRFRVRKKAFRIKTGYPPVEGNGKVLKIINSPAHTAPIALVQIGGKKFYNIAALGMYEGQDVEMGRQASLNSGNICHLENLSPGTKIYNLEITALDGGKLIKSGGLSGTIVKKIKKGVIVALPSKKEKLFPYEARATIGAAGGGGRRDKPFVKAGKVWHIKRAKGKPYPLTSPIKMNAIAHPFGSGRGKRIKSKIAIRNAPPGAKVGLIRPGRTGRRKR